MIQLMCCQACGSPEKPDRIHIGFVGAFRFTLCRKCVGEAMRQMVKYIRDFTALYGEPARKPRKGKALIDQFGARRCRECSVQLHEQPGPVCGECGKSLNPQADVDLLTLKRGV